MSISQSLSFLFGHLVETLMPLLKLFFLVRAHALPLFIMHLLRVWKTHTDEDLDPYLKQLAISILLLSILFGLGINL